VQLVGDLNKLKSLPGYLAIRPFSNSPVISDLSGFDIDAGDLNELKNCKPNDCEVQLPEENIEEFTNKIEWSGPDPATQADRLAKEMALFFYLGQHCEEGCRWQDTVVT